MSDNKASVSKFFAPVFYDAELFTEFKRKKIECLWISLPGEGNMALCLASSPLYQPTVIWECLANNLSANWVRNTNIATTVYFITKTRKKVFMKNFKFEKKERTFETLWSRCSDA